VCEDGRHHAGDAGRHRVEPDDEHRHLGVAGKQGAVAAAADVAVATEVDELVAGGSRHENVARIRVPKRRPRPGEAVGLVE
jgi:hypothetical protein